MTFDKSDHRGSVFFALPDGSSIMYQLIGQATAPLPIAAINRTMPCKSPYTYPLVVKNWLKVPQRFKVIKFFKIIKNIKKFLKYLKISINYYY